jgi:hypothetical protein
VNTKWKTREDYYQECLSRIREADPEIKDISVWFDIANTMADTLSELGKGMRSGFDSTCIPLEAFVSKEMIKYLESIFMAAQP